VSLLVSDIYAVVCDALMEPGGFVLGVCTEAQFLNALAVVMLDFSQRGTINMNIFTEMITAGNSKYIVPEDLMEPQLCFVGGRLIEKVTEADLTQGHFEWKREWGPPRQWHEDNLPVKQIELFPKPDFNGAEVDGDAPPIGTYDGFFPSQHNLTIVGPQAPSKTAWTLADTLDDVADSFGYYISYGILEQIFSADGENRDLQRAAYAKARKDEGIAISNALAQEELLEDFDA
jgi:hypothetical protein